MDEEAIESTQRKLESWIRIFILFHDYIIEIYLNFLYE